MRHILNSVVANLPEDMLCALAYYATSKSISLCRCVCMCVCTCVHAYVLVYSPTMCICTYL